jgi:hemolysin activation/secretion protein
VSRVLHRNADGKTSAGVSFTTKKINNFLEHERLRPAAMT